MSILPALTDLATRLQRRELSCETLVAGLLERIAAREPTLQAWTHLDPQQVLAAARTIDAASATGPLHGIPVGVKDVFDTFDMPTAYGSPIYAGHRPRADAAVVAGLRGAGGLVMGKTVTTEFATFPPGPTANPWNLAHTPGGSSSGSAAAVAAAMVPVAFGTQTAGSVIRPAAFCGVVGYKPSFGLLPRTGVKAISDCLDSVGCFARSTADAAFFVGALTRRALAVGAPGAPPRIGVCLTPYWDAALPETRDLFATLGKRLSAAGSMVSDYSHPSAFEGLNQAQEEISSYEIARCLADEYRRFPDRIRARLLRQLEAGSAMAAQQYDARMLLADRCRQQLSAALGDLDVLVVPSCPGVAPAGLEATGDPVFNRAWTLLHAPCVHVPLTFGPDGLPLGVQVVGRLGDDARVLACADWIETRLRESAATVA
jgi:amidase